MPLTRNALIGATALIAVLAMAGLTFRDPPNDLLGYGTLDARSICERTVRSIKLGLWAPDARDQELALLLKPQIDRHVRSLIGEAKGIKVRVASLETGIPRCSGSLRPTNNAELAIVSIVNQGIIELSTWHFSNGPDVVCLSGNPNDDLIAIEALRKISIGKLVTRHSADQSRRPAISWNSTPEVAQFRAGFPEVVNAECTAGSPLTTANNVDAANLIWRKLTP